MFDRSITEAAEALGVGLTVLKKHWPGPGDRCAWPHRKIDSINKLILVFEVRQSSNVASIFSQFSGFVLQAHDVSTFPVTLRPWVTQ